LKHLSYEESREKIYLLRDEGKFLQAIEVSQLLTNELLSDLVTTNIPEQQNTIKKFLMNNYYIEGAILRQVNNLFQSEILLHKGLEIAFEYNDVRTISKIYSALANNHFQNGNLEYSLELLNTGFSYIENTDFVLEAIILQGNMGQIHSMLGEFEKADEILTTLVHSLELLKKREYLGNAYYSLALLKYNRNQYEETIIWLVRSIDQFEKNNKPRNLYMSKVELIRTFIQLNEIEKAEETIEQLNQITFEGKGEKEELEKLILFVNIFIKRQEYTIAIFSLDSILTNLDSVEQVVCKIIIRFLRAVIHCLSNENEKAIELIEKIYSEIDSTRYIIHITQTNYIQAWAEFNLENIENAENILMNSFKKTKGKIFNFDMFYLTKNFLVFLNNTNKNYLLKQQS